MKSAYLGLLLLSNQRRFTNEEALIHHEPPRTGRGRSKRRTGAIAAAVVSALVVGFGVGTARAADPALDVAFTALEKAEAAINASQSGNLPPKAQHQFDRHTSRAVSHIELAMAQIDAAKDVVDNP